MRLSTQKMPNPGPRRRRHPTQGRLPWCCVGYKYALISWTVTVCLSICLTVGDVYGGHLCENCWHIRAECGTLVQGTCRRGWWGWGGVGWGQVSGASQYLTENNRTRGWSRASALNRSPQEALGARFIGSQIDIADGHCILCWGSHWWPLSMRNSHDHGFVWGIGAGCVTAAGTATADSQSHGSPHHPLTPTLRPHATTPRPTRDTGSYPQPPLHREEATPAHAAA